jgi:hypothetical protein
MRERMNHLRNIGLAAALAGTVAMGACGVENPSHPNKPAATMAGDAYPTVETVVAPESVAAADNIGPIDMDSLTSTIANDPKPPAYELYEDPNPITKKDVGDFPASDSAPLLDVMLGSDNKLHFKNYLSGSTTNEENQLLSAVQGDSVFLTATMRAGKLDNLRFRMQKPEENPDPDFPQSQFPIQIPQDVHGKKMESNIYYFLPGSGQVDGNTVKTMVAHETGHQALGHGKIDLAKSTADHQVAQPIFTPEQKQDFEALDKDLRHAVAEDAPTAQIDAMDAYETLKEQMPEKYQATMDKVSEAINNGEYDKLPTVGADETPIPAGDMENPIIATRLLLDKRGINKDDFIKVGDRDNGDGDDESLSGTVMDAWNDQLEKDSVFLPFTESQVLDSDTSADEAGHLQDGADEQEASTGSTVLTDTDRVAELINQQTPEDKALDLRLADTTIRNLKAALPNDPAFINLADTKLKALHDAVGQ